eukprot:TRINITY_DN120813_c0_g1_i1.p1 TRINITY_DN120813_c0_g1~~TRINITY_DN120813_c0_g1_i1.p1  ORF type:complete len:376 (+),score=79.51 TRINITY_DN120813_c0_g1_i1:91-1218(+)
MAKDSKNGSYPALFEHAVCAPEIAHKSIEDYYGKQLATSDDLKTDACCTAAAPPKHIREVMKLIHDDVMAKYYGCGLCIPDGLEGCKVLDLGCGAGRDVYLLSKLVGEKGAVYGIDMTAEQLAVAERADVVEWHREKFGYKAPNAHFVKGFIEKAADALPPDAVGQLDVIVSNCVVNLSPDKRSVFQSAFKLLKEGGEMYFSDVYCSERVPTELKQNETLAGECLSGALYWNDFLRLAKECGFGDPRLVADAPIGVRNEKLQSLLPPSMKFFSATYRLFKLKDLEPDCEDYGQAIRYKGTVANCRDEFMLDNHHIFRTGKIESVCGNTYNMLHQTRLSEHFEFFGDFSKHYGIFPGCGKNMPFSSADTGGAGACC